MIDDICYICGCQLDGLDLMAGYHEWCAAMTPLGEDPSAEAPPESLPAEAAPGEKLSTDAELSVR